MPNVMATLPNIGGALCSTPQFGWRPLLEYAAKKRKPVQICSSAQNSPTDLSR